MSKGLEAYERILNNVHDIELDNPEQFDSDMLIIAKELKALEIIRTKHIDTAKLFLLTSAYWYNNFGKVEVIQITQDEYDLLKEVLA